MKKLLIHLSLLFSFCFLGIYNIKALNFQGVNITDDLLNTAWSYFDNKSYNEISGVTYDDWRTRPYKKEDFNSIVIYYASNSGGILNIVFLPTDELTPKKSYLEFPSTSMPNYGYWTAIPVAQYFISNSSFTTRFNSTLTYYPDSQYYIANFDCTFKDVFYPKDFEFDLNPPEKSFNINFHLNGGNLANLNFNEPFTYNSDFSLDTNDNKFELIFDDTTTIVKNNYEFVGWYYDSEFTQPFNITDEITNDLNLYAKFDKLFHNVTFHLNGGWVYNESIDFGSDEDFTVTLYKNEFNDFMRNLKPSKLKMIFDNFYYDNQFTQPLNITDELTNDIDLYLKWRYEKVDDFLNNTTFNSYTFDTDYDYAIITRGNNTGDIYLGFEIMTHNFELYEYDITNNNYIQGAKLCLLPIYSKNNFYYYQMSQLNSNIEVLIIPKSKLEIDGKTYYNFKLTSNANITYTNSLSNTIIYDDNNNTIDTNLSDSYNYSQNIMLNDKDLWDLFNNLYENKENEIFKYFNDIWNEFRKTELYNYFIILITGALIIIIIKAAKRS